MNPEEFDDTQSYQIKSLIKWFETQLMSPKDAILTMVCLISYILHKSELCEEDLVGISRRLGGTILEQVKSLVKQDNPQ